MAERVSLGGKGSSLSSSSVYDTAIAISQIRLDSSALTRLSSSLNSNKHLTKHKIVIPNFLTHQECRASLVVLLNQLLISASSNVRTVLPELISQTLNSNPANLEFDELELTEEELYVVKNGSSVLLGVAAILDRKVEALSVFADGAAAVSCEALRAEVTAFNLIDSGDGHTGKEEVGVASDTRVLLNGSKLIGKAKIDSVSKIPKVHGSIRTQVKQLHANTRVELNSGVSSGTDEAVRAVLSAMATALLGLGKCSLSRVKNNLDSIGNENLRSRLEGIFEKQCLIVGGGLSNRVLSELVLEEDNDMYAHKVNELLETVWKIVVLEAITGYISLESMELSEKGQGFQVDGENVKAERKSEKKKKPVLGKGTSVILQLMKERLQNLKIDVGENLEFLEKWVDSLLSFFDLKDLEFRNFLVKMKEIVESNESRRLPKLPKGTRDFAKEQMTIRKEAFSIIEEVFERHGATALDTPVFELRETLMGKYGEDSKLIYDLADQGGELCSLRYDLTVPFARFVAMNGVTSLKRYQIAKVYRRDNPSKGRYREFYQCDFDVAGQYEKMGPDFEVVRILTELLDELQIGDYEVKLNHRRLLDGMLEICGVPPEKFRTICSSIDKLDKQPFEQVKREMVEEKGLSVETADRIGGFVKERGPPLELLHKLKREGSKFLEHEGLAEALNDLEILFNALEKSKRIDRIVFDLSLARGLDYYTGVIFEAVFKGGTQVGSIAAGGRYDNLIGMFGNKQVPAVGASLGIERVFTIMEQLHKDQNQTPRATKTEVLVSILGDDLSQASELVSELWDAKVKAEFLVNKKIKKHIDRAVESRIPWMVIQGERELSEGILKLKDVVAAKEEPVPRSQIVDEIKKRLNR